MMPPLSTVPDAPAVNASAPPESRIAVFVSGLDDTPSGRAAVALANALHRRTQALDVVAPMGGGPLRAALHPGIGQIDLAKRHTATSILALARIVAERRPAGLVGAGSDAGLAALAAARLAGRDTPVAVPVAVLDDSPPPQGGLRRALRGWLHPRASAISDGATTPEEAARLFLAAFGFPEPA
ncbi:hypothetical protein [Azospirillum isscasi]|uniref:Uncharacterized protein n=1 Tax=Azospirillum isscasi TaxID=3053926 RepID=A0ABU0WEH3_9PROT|nr:hypothetical protein [Azospirillum isscasi]MDQ2102614.1 hypothetical protein [Azospirillum isscasi]